MRINSALALSLLFAACIFGMAINTKPEELKAQQEFARYMQSYNKVYTEEEFGLRYQNFKASLLRIEQENAKAQKATFGITKFSDMSTEEFHNTILMSKPIEQSTKPKDVIKPKNVEVAPVLDWRTKGAVTPIKNQEQCGSCWAFSVTENIESMWILAGKGTNETVDFAPQQIVDCDTSDDGCNGGDPPTAYAYVMAAGGIESEKSYPYTAETENCDFHKNETVGKISSWKYATTQGDETTLQNNLISWGPLSICVDAAAWQDYVSGIMTWYDCAFFNELDHCVQLVGYNQVSYEDSYWIVRNSWGTDWGVEGYIWLEMGEDTCGITYEATTSVI